MRRSTQLETGRRLRKVTGCCPVESEVRREGEQGWLLLMLLSEENLSLLCGESCSW
jgi:hypothetical protein